MLNLAATIAGNRATPRPVITGATWGWCYLLHFSERLGNLSNPRAQAQHYTGWAADPNGDGTGLERRIAEHLAGQGAKITRAAIGRGIELTVVATWRAPKTFEKVLKRRKDGPMICPVCCEARGRRPAQPTVAEQLDYEPWPEGFEFPDPPRLPLDREEIGHYFLQRALRPIVQLPPDWDEGLL